MSGEGADTWAAAESGCCSRPVRDLEDLLGDGQVAGCRASCPKSRGTQSQYGAGPRAAGKYRSAEAGHARCLEGVQRIFAPRSQRSHGGRGYADDSEDRSESEEVGICGF